MTEVVLVMSRPGNVAVMQQALVQLGVSGTGVPGEHELQARLDESPPPRLAIVDVTGFGAAAWRMCAALQERGVPFVVLSAPRDLEMGSQSLGYGAAGILQKPIAKSALLQLIRGLTE